MNTASFLPTRALASALALTAALLLAGCASAGNQAKSEQAAADPGMSCKTDADCAIKDIGSCCGYNPRCVNKDSPTFPEQVKAQCADSGRAGVCGFPSISGCECKQGKCAGIAGPDDGQVVQ